MSIYFDYAASSIIHPKVASAIYEWHKTGCGNPSSVHREGQKGRIKIESVRDRVAALIKARPKEIIFTSGGTEANNLSIRGLLSSKSLSGKKHIILSSTEHPSINETVLHLKKSGFEVDFIPVSQQGEIDTNDIKSRLRPDTGLVSCMMVNNETGIIYPVQEIAEICRQEKVVFHCDAVQAFGKMAINLQKFPADLVSFSAHKINGPKGIGGLFVRDGVPLDKLFYGGGQEANRRPGTENIAGIVGLGRAIEIFSDADNEWQRLGLLKHVFEHELIKKIPGTIIIGRQAPRSPYISSVAFPGIDNQSLLLNLDMHGLAASVGSACSSGSIRPSRVISAMGFTNTLTQSVIRFSFGRFTTESEIDRGLAIICAVLNKMRKA